MLEWIKKFMARKALFPLLYALMVVVNNITGNHISEDMLVTIAGVIVAFILGESVIDAVRANANGRNR